MSVDPTIVAGLGLTAAVLGLVVGSFLNVVVWRVPRGESVVAPASACPSCGTPILARDNVPVLSWILLRARCRECGSRISARYPAVELVTAALFVAFALLLARDAQSIWAIPAFLYLASIGVALALIDLDTHRLPNAIVLPAYGVSLVRLGAATAVTGDWLALARAGIGGVGLFVMYFTLAVIVPKGMGFGDVKLAGVLGIYLAWLGWDALAVGAFAAFVLGGIYSMALLAMGRAKRGSGIPFGPWMLAGAGVGIFFGEPIAASYLALVGLR